MRELPFSNCEREFIQKSIKNQRRLDGRAIDEFRKLRINFGADWGSVLVALGETKVLAQVSCQLGLPKAVRPNEGMLFINVEIGSMAAPHVDPNRFHQLQVQINRTLERAFKDSRAVDLESLCVRAEEHVWTLRVDLNVLNHEGNLIDCCSIATLAALTHFRRPDVTIVEGSVVIPTVAQKEPLPTVLHHFPMCVSYVTFNDGKTAIVDPTANEERTAESTMVFGFNSYRELCCLNLSGNSLTSSKLLLQCANRAATQAKKIVDHVRELLAADKEARDKGIKVGFTECLKAHNITGLAEDSFALCLPAFNLAEAAGRITVPMEEDVAKVEADEEQVAETKADKSKIILLDTQSAILKSNQANIKWMPDLDDDDEDMNLVNLNHSDDDNEQETRNYDDLLADLRKTHATHFNANDSDSEEEQKMTL